MWLGTHNWARFLEVVSLAMLWSGCGGKSELLEGRSAGCDLPEAVRGVVATGDETTCAMEGKDADGHVHRMECFVSGTSYPREFAGCRWITEGELACTCDTPDWASTCGNGIPLCVGWNAPFDFAHDVEFQP